VDASGNIRRSDSTGGLFRYTYAGEKDASGNPILSSVSTRSSSSSSTTSSSSSTDNSGNLISLTLSDLIKALTFANTTSNTQDVLNPPVYTPSTNVLPVAVTGGTLSEETEKRIAQQVSKNIKDEMLVQRSTTPVIPASGNCAGGGDGCDSDGSASCAQGSQYMSGAPYDSSDYIRKDSIPCWGCKLPQ
jgi:hypothetical protein